MKSLQEHLNEGLLNEAKEIRNKKFVIKESQDYSSTLLNKWLKGIDKEFSMTKRFAPIKGDKDNWGRDRILNMLNLTKEVIITQKPSDRDIRNLKELLGNASNRYPEGDSRVNTYLEQHLPDWLIKIATDLNEDIADVFFNIGLNYV